jgi:hypothetical protein
MSEEEIYINQPLTTMKIVEILDHNPQLKKINCPPSLYHRTPQKYLDALDELGITVEPLPRKGRPKKYGNQETLQINQMIKEGYGMKEISEKMNIPLKTVYYLKSKPLKRGRKSKYDQVTIRKVGELRNKGMNPREISKKMKIPLRSVYSIFRR